METLKELLSLNIKSLRGKSITQAQAAERAGIPFRTYQEIEAGHVWPQHDNLIAIAAAFGVSPHTLFDKGRKPTPAEALAVLSGFFGSLGPDNADLVVALSTLDNTQRDTVRRVLQTSGLLPKGKTEAKKKTG